MVGVIWALRPRPPLPDAIYSRLNFPLLAPASGSAYKIQQSTAKYNAPSRVVLFHVANGNQNMLVTEQATPDPFNDIPNYYQTLVNDLRDYADISTASGTVSLTRPVELKGQQTAVSNNKGVLIFVRPNHDLSEDQWRAFFNDLAMVKPH